MKVITDRFGVIDVKEEAIITMVEPILGFPYAKRYVLLDHREGSPFKWLQSVDDGSLAFVVINPKLVKPDYVVPIDKEDAEKLEIEKPEDAEVYVMVVIPEDPRKMTVNLRGPIVINKRKRLAKQIVIPDDSYPVKYPVIREENACSHP
ncbi:flagellar assembly factor FliW [Thermosulfidibacter takaii ABI70S6]|uniref:Flagellar assembly factor FliW n=1 Tax=Thermosulfidibacter takaii (strain DSM 17441 / JCM 13301 / NBRC 103674 / ABI70S6) TaxID=1298851 RepID=A0A0S3QST9_THET7|nr:flagellar assembly protein FliW [Thermosulfidibacter takaii]BAT71411.1 flagellar assembly factor FliW [Thermosulfidibacter takaii ABI70S6]